MPLGNGDISVNAWVEPDGDLRFYLGKTDAWDDNAQLLKVGRIRVHFEPALFAPGQPFRQVLNTQEGSLEVEFGGEAAATVKVWVDANHPVIQVEAKSTAPVEATAFLELWRTNRLTVATLQTSDIFNSCPTNDPRYAPTITEPDSVLSAAPGRVGWYHHNSKSVGPGLLAEVQGLAGFKQVDPLLHRTFGAVATAARGARIDDRSLRSPRNTTHQFSIFVQTSHPASPEAWKTAMDRLITRVESESYETRWKAHQAWWREFWNRSWIQAATAGSPAAGDDAAQVSQMYRLQRFVTACAGRGAYPIKFNGSIFTVPPPDGNGNADFRRWGPGYWWQNTRLPYLSACASGDFDLLRPLVRMYTGEVFELSKYRTRQYCGHGGVFFPECIYFWGPMFSETYGWTPYEKRADKLQESRWHKWEWVGGLELCWLLLDQYEYTQDKRFLQQTVLPFTTQILAFFEQHYPTNDQRQLVMHPSQSLETWWECTNPMPEIAGCRAVTERLLTLPGSPISTEQRSQFRRLLAQLPPVPTRQIEGKTALAPAASFAQKCNVENPELYAVYPFRLFGVGRPNLDWAITALDQRTDKGHFGWRQDDLFMAYLGMTDAARAGVVERAKNHDPASRFPAFWGPNYDWIPDQDHGGVLMKTLQSMLLQTDGQRLFLFPAWPKNWNVEFKLRAPYRTVIEGVYRDGQVRSLKVTPKARQADLVSEFPL
jgi:alpha-L-fucosidase 2